MIAGQQFVMHPGRAVVAEPGMDLIDLGQQRLVSGSPPRRRACRSGQPPVVARPGHAHYPAGHADVQAITAGLLRTDVPVDIYRYIRAYEEGQRFSEDLQLFGLAGQLTLQSGNLGLIGLHLGGAPAPCRDRRRSAALAHVAIVVADTLNSRDSPMDDRPSRRCNSAI